MMKTPLIAVFLGLISLTAVAAVEGGAPLANVNGKVITLDHFNKRFQESTRYQHFRQPSKKSFLDEMVRRELAVQEAKKIGLDKDPEVMERIDSLLAQSLMDKKLSGEIEKISVSDSDAKSFYSKNPEIRTSHIFVALRPDASPENEKKAMEKIQEIQKKYLADGKMSFAEVAQRYSEGPSAPMGGDIDYQTKDRLDPAYYDAAMGLRSPGKVSGIVRSSFGLHIIKLTAVRSWEEVDKGKIKRLVFESERQELMDKYINDLRKQAKISVNSDLLKE